MSESNPYTIEEQALLNNSQELLNLVASDEISDEIFNLATMIYSSVTKVTEAASLDRVEHRSLKRMFESLNKK